MTDPYLGPWDPRAYLEQYYSTPHLPDDCAAVLAFLREQLPRRPGGYERALEFGCGPTVWAALAIAPHVGRLEMVDYLPTNLQQIRLWLDGAGHDWGVYARAALRGERGREPTAAEVVEREAELRAKIVGLRRGDVRQPHPLGEPREYDLVASFYCIEAASPDGGEWATFLGRLASLVAPGGTLVMAAIRRCRGYAVLGRTFPAAPVDEEDFNRELPRLGFVPASLVIRPVPVRDWVEEGFDGICCVRAVKQAR